MKKTPVDPNDDLRPHYYFDFKKMKPNRYAGMGLKSRGRRLIFLDEDVADVFDSSEAVNAVLRSAIKAMRTAAPKRVTRKPAASRKSKAS